MFHIPISAIKYLCAKYNFFSTKGRKDSGHQRPGTPQFRKKGKSPKPKQRRRETLLKLAKLSPQQVMGMLWKKNVISPVKVPRSSSGI
ncbi:hypothetical protein AB205_0189550 [Aquarana catesbeiana]|uniref:Uncharacterized protein n=1 Tax=Aquarana catesbeiana TaxID=8400 RepID=A0A2G9PER8_AQUCT|nr:hypothetical protein AB205_0189550 [Aquarana catesbeiana]